MEAPAQIDPIPKARTVTAVARGLAACLLGVGVLWWVAAHAGPSRGEVIVHVTEPDVEVVVGGHVFRFDEWPERPVACELPVGSHTLRMWRGRRLLYEESFVVPRGENVVLTAWSSHRDDNVADGPTSMASPGEPAKSDRTPSPIAWRVWE